MADTKALSNLDGAFVMSNTKQGGNMDKDQREEADQMIREFVKNFLPGDLSDEMESQLGKEKAAEIQFEAISRIIQAKGDLNESVRASLQEHLFTGLRDGMADFNGISPAKVIVRQMPGIDDEPVRHFDVVITRLRGSDLTIRVNVDIVESAPKERM